MVERLELRLKMNNIQEINKKIENLKNEIVKLNKEKERLMIQDSNISDIVSNGYIKIEDGNMTAIMKVNKVSFDCQNSYSIQGFSISINGQSLLINQNSTYTKHLLFDKETAKITKIDKDEFVKLTNEMIKKSLKGIEK